jgi:hypothetical protein
MTPKLPTEHLNEKADHSGSMLQSFPKVGLPICQIETHHLLVGQPLMKQSWCVNLIA